MEIEFINAVKIVGAYGYIPEGSNCKATKYDDTEYSYKVISESFVYDISTDDEACVWVSEQELSEYK